MERCRRRPAHSLQDGRAPPAKRKYQFLGPRGRSTHAMHTASGGQHGEGQKKCKRRCPRGRIEPPQMQGSIYMCAASRPLGATRPHVHRRRAAQVQSEGERCGPGGPICSSPIAAQHPRYHSKLACPGGRAAGSRTRACRALCPQQPEHDSS